MLLNICTLNVCHGASPGSSVVKKPPDNAGDAYSTPGPGRSPGGGHGNPLQYSCLENPMDRKAWWATVHRVTKSWTWLRQLITQTHVLYLNWKNKKAKLTKVAPNQRYPTGFRVKTKFFILSFFVCFLEYRWFKICVILCCTSYILSDQVSEFVWDSPSFCHCPSVCITMSPFIQYILSRPDTAGLAWACSVL